MPPLLCRSFRCCNAAFFASSTISKQKNLIFLGSPQVNQSLFKNASLCQKKTSKLQLFQVSLPVLDLLLDASTSQSSIFRLAAIVTQPASRRDRGRKVMPSPVARRALERGFPHEVIFTPESAGEVQSMHDF